MKRVIKSATNTCGMAAKITSSDEDRVDYGYDDYEWLATKDVQDSDGFLTDYTMYRRRSDGMYVMVFGDRDFYSPEDGDFDYETEDEQDAWDWFDSYTGFDDEDEDLDILSATYTDMDGDTQDYSDWGVELVEDIDDRSAIVRDGSGRYTRWSKSSNRPLSRINKNNEYVPVWYNSIDEIHASADAADEIIWVIENGVHSDLFVGNSPKEVLNELKSGKLPGTEKYVVKYKNDNVVLEFTISEFLDEFAN